MNENKPLVITINRQFGSGGAYIGRQLAKELGMKYVDKELLSKAADQMDKGETELWKQDERLPVWWDSFMNFNMWGDSYVSTNLNSAAVTSANLFNTEKKIMQQLAEENPIVVIGRCGFDIFKDYPRCIKIYLHADSPFRVERIKQKYNVESKEAEKMIKSYDKARKEYTMMYTGKHVTDARLYDLCVDTGKMGVAKTLKFILNYVKLFNYFT